jgi:hypothetical protein
MVVGCEFFVGLKVSIDEEPYPIVAKDIPKFIPASG